MNNLKAAAVELSNYQASVQEPGGSGGKPDVMDPLDGIVAAWGRVLKAASPQTLKRWISFPNKFSEDFAVAKRDGLILRRDRYDLPRERALTTQDNVYAEFLEDM